MAQRVLGLEPFDYSQVRLLPRESVVASRSDCSVSAKVGGREFGLPVVPSNMPTLIGEDLAHWCASEGYFYIMHRFGVDSVEFTDRFHSEHLYASVSIGIKETDYESVSRMAKLSKPPEYLCVDVAHGHARRVADFVRHLHSTLPDSFIIAGNVGTVAGASALRDAGAHAIKVGIGPGSPGVHTPDTGFTTKGWQAAAVESIANSLSDVLIIADGGVRDYGDVAKAVALGADLVMMGTRLAGHDQSPGELVESNDGQKQKVFQGDHAVPYMGDMTDTYADIKEALQSAVSYAGGRELSVLREVQYVVL